MLSARRGRDTFTDLEFEFHSFDSEEIEEIEVILTKEGTHIRINGIQTTMSPEADLPRELLDHKRADWMAQYDKIIDTLSMPVRLLALLCHYQSVFRWDDYTYHQKAYFPVVTIDRD